MAKRIRIECVNKTPRQDPHKRIENVGGLNHDGTRWKMPEERAVQAIDNGTYSFYVSVNSQTVDVVVATHERHKYLKTKADSVQPNNLLSLPECP
jgi:uncharacterized protein YfaP (DUF2135 family)